MNNEEILRGREEYKELSAENDRRKQIEKRLFQLESMKKVSEYISLLDEVGRKPETHSIAVSNTVLASYAFDNIAFNTENSNKIYVHMGPKVEVDNTRSREYDVYKDLETTRELSIRKCDVKKFEDSHTVIKPDNTVNSLSFYNALRNCFFKRIIETSQEEAVKKILGRSKTK